MVIVLSIERRIVVKVHVKSIMSMLHVQHDDDEVGHKKLISPVTGVRNLFVILRLLAESVI